MNARKTLFPVALLFIIINTLVLTFGSRLEKAGLDINALMAGNLFIFLITLVSIFILLKGLNASSTMKFIRSVYTAFIIKFFLVAVVVFVYALMEKENLNRPAVFLCMFLYLLYTFLEVRVLLKLTKSKTDGEKRSTP